MAKVSHFEISFKDPVKGAKFYQDIFDWKVEKWQGGGGQDYWLVTTGPESEIGINGGFMGKMEGTTQPVVNTISVDNVDTFSKKILDTGGKEAMPKMAIPNMGYVAYFTDPEGILFGIFEEDKSAA